MTKIISLTLKGFKSFGKLITINFSDRLTGVVGPNGSGKSNILDALTFVIGRLGMSQLRAKKGSELIYTKPGGAVAEYAEVKMVLDNNNKVFGDVGERVVISRRVRPDGMSFYRVNGKRYKRGQVLDLLATAQIFPDGHNIVFQGDITNLINMNSVERRQIIDEIAGIQEYEEKKQKALLEFQRVDARINEINLLVAERQRALEKLKREAEAAERFGKLEYAKKVYQASLVKKDIEEHANTKSKLSGELKSTEEEITKLSQELEELDKELTTLGNSRKALEKNISQAQSEESIKLTKEAERLSNEFANALAAAKRFELEKESVLGRMSELRKAESELRSRIEENQSLATKQQHELKAITGERKALEDRRLEILSTIAREEEGRKDAATVAAGLKSKLMIVREKERTLLLQLDRLNQELNSKEKEAAKLKTQIAEVKKHNQKVNEQKRILEDSLSQLRQKERELETLRLQSKSDSETLEKKIAEFHKSIAYAEALAGLERTHSELLTQSGVLGKAGSLFTADKKYLVALLAACEPEAIFVDSRESVKKIIKYIQENKLSRVTLIPLDTETEPSELTKFARTDKKFSNALNALFGQKKLVSTLDELLQEKNAVTLDGVVVENGRITAGTVTADAEQELKELNIELVKATENKLDSAQKFEHAARELQRVAREANKLELQLETLMERTVEDTEAEELESAIRKLKESRKELEKDIEAVREDAEALAREEKERALAPIDFSKMHSVDRELTSVREKETTLTNSLNELKNNLNNFLNPELQRITRTLNSLERDTVSIDKDSEKLTKETELLRTAAAIKRTEAEESLKGVRGLIDEREKLTKTIEKQGQAKLKTVETLATARGSAEHLKGETGKEDALVRSLTESITGVTRFFEGSVNKLKHKLSRVEERLQKMGPVNFAATTELGNATDEFADVESRKKTLDEEKQSILNLMTEVEKKKKEVFMENFTAIAKSFSDLYSRVTGGQGNLILEDEGVFNGGMLIEASPKGKEVFNIDAMSGGEKVLTALAFLFSIQEHKPAPFYVFDEVDAALDKENSEKLARLLTIYKERAQLIVITHNDSVIRVADQLIGVFISPSELTSKVVSADERFMQKYMVTA